MAQQLKARLRACFDDEAGQDLVEYALVAALIGVAATMFLHTLSGIIGSAFNSVGNGLANGTGGGNTVSQ